MPNGLKNGLRIKVETIWFIGFCFFYYRFVFFTICIIEKYIQSGEEIGSRNPLLKMGQPHGNREAERVVRAARSVTRP